MKIAAILLMLLGVCMIIGYGFLYILGFAMSFDAPGSAEDPKAWMMRLLIFLPIVIFIVLLIFALVSFLSGHYQRSVIFGSVFGISGLAFVLYMFISTFGTMNKMKAANLKEAEEARLYPIEKYLRPVEGGVDTIIVFPNRIVSYRLYVGTEIPYGGPLGEMNETRDTIVFSRRSDTKIVFEDLPQFIDERGRRFTDVYYIR